MALHASEAQFKARQNKHSEGWSVHVTWDTGRTAQVNNFADRAEAEEWIKNKSAGWLQARQTGSHD
jgi:hypothetical protein